MRKWGGGCGGHLVGPAAGEVVEAARVEQLGVHDGAARRQRRRPPQLARRRLPAHHSALLAAPSGP